MALKSEDLMVENFKELILTALALDFPVSLPGLRESPRFEKNLASSLIPAAVLILFAFPHDSKHSQSPSILYTKRTETLAVHKGQISFPGGRTDAEDLQDSVVTALRETEEETGIFRNQIEVLGRLPSLITNTGYDVVPIVGIATLPLDHIALQLSAEEISEALWVPLDHLLHPNTYKREVFKVGEVGYPIDVFDFHHHRIWGVTGTLTKNLLDRLSSVG